MNNPTKDLIERLGSTELKLGSKVYFAEGERICIGWDDSKVYFVEDTTDFCDVHSSSVPKDTNVENPILIGDVLSKIPEDRPCDLDMVRDKLEICATLLEYWQPCGFTRSVQEIGEDAEPTGKLSFNGTQQFRSQSLLTYKPIMQLKPEAQALIDFLNEVL